MIIRGYVRASGTPGSRSSPVLQGNMRLSKPQAFSPYKEEVWTSVRSATIDKIKDIISGTTGRRPGLSKLETDRDCKRQPVLRITVEGPFRDIALQ